MSLPGPQPAFASPFPSSKSAFTPRPCTSPTSRSQNLRPRASRRRPSTVFARASASTQEDVPLSDSSFPDEPEKLPTSKLPVVAVIGRPNVGKSTLVNRFAGAFRDGAIVENVVGITRDRTYRAATWNGYSFQVVDTGGLVFDDQSTFLPEIRAQALIAIRQAAAVVLCVDGQEGINPLDEELARFLRRETKKAPVFIAVNKCESEAGFAVAGEFWSLGLGEPFPVSAIHGSGTGDLLDRVVEELPMVIGELEEDVVNIAIVGRPNVGKSSLLNVMAGDERAIVSDIPGTTRDAVDEMITVHGKRYRLIDTAGIRRKTNVSFGTEFFMINRAFKAIRRADVVLLMLDVSEASEQDRKIADRIAAEGKGCIVLANKWDLVSEKDNRSYTNAVEEVRERTVCIPWAPVELVSVLEKKRIGKIISLVEEALEQHRKRVSTAVLNEVLREAVEWHKPPATKAARQGRIYYCTQVASRPPTIAMFVNEPKLFHENYRRYMHSQFRKALGFKGTPIRLVWRGKSKPPVLT